MLVGNCKTCNIKIIDTGYKPEPLPDLCEDCEEKEKTGTPTVKIEEDIFE